jgi:hypothetical protein
MAQPAPKVRTNRAADASLTLAASQAGLDLTNRSTKPPFAPQRLLLVNQTAAAITAGVTLVDEENVSHSVTVPAGTPFPWDGLPIKTLTTPASVITHAFWWERGELPRQPFAVPARNP